MADTKKEAIYYGTGRRKNAIARVPLTRNRDEAMTHQNYYKETSFSYPDKTIQKQLSGGFEP